jgi:transporter family-2 protein
LGDPIRKEGFLNSAILIGAMGALLTGIAISLQSTITSRAGALIGNLNTGLLTNFMGGIIAGSWILFLLLRQGAQGGRQPASTLGFIALSGLLGIFIVTGISFSLQRTGVAAGLASVILGQLIGSVLMDHWGIGAAGVIPIDIERILGLITIAVGVYLLLPRTG